MHYRHKIGREIQDVGGNKKCPASSHAGRLSKMERRSASGTVRRPGCPKRPGNKRTNVAGTEPQFSGCHLFGTHPELLVPGSLSRLTQRSRALNDDATAASIRVKPPKDQRATPGMMMKSRESFTSATSTPNMNISTIPQGFMLLRTRRIRAVPGGICRNLSGRRR